MGYLISIDPPPGRESTPTAAARSIGNNFRRRSTLGAVRRRRARKALPAVAFAAVVVSFLFCGAAASDAPHTSTLETLGKIREDWVQDLRGKKLEPVLIFRAPDAALWRRWRDECGSVRSDTR